MAMRRLVLHKGVVGGLLLVFLVVGGAAIALAAPPPPPAVIVGTNPTVQAWFKNTYEPQRIALFNALEAAYQQLGQGSAPGPGDGCQRLLQAADAVLGMPAPPKQTLQPLVVAGVGQIKAGAQQCLSGQAATARNTLQAAGKLRGDADLQIDEILEKPNGSVK
jgi:hypothetical protein